MGNSFIDKNRSWLTGLHLKVLFRHRALPHGGARWPPGSLSPLRPSGHLLFNSCRNRHCPKCQTNARDKWLAARGRELLPVPVRACGLHDAARVGVAGSAQPEKLLYDLLFRASAATLLESRRRSQASGSRDRFPERAAHLGAEACSSSAYSLRDSSRRSVARSPAAGFTRAIRSSCR